MYDSEVYRSRVERLQAVLREKGMGAMVVSSWPNIEYLTGLRSLQSMVNSFDPMPLVVASQGQPAYVCTAIFAKVIRAEYPWLEAAAFSEDELIAPQVDRWEAVKGVVEAMHAQRGVVGYEETALTAKHFVELRRVLPEARLEPFDSVVPELRLRKSPLELDALRAASEVTNRAFERLLEHGVREGMSERELEVLIARCIAEEGATPSFIQVFVGGRTCYGNIAPSPDHAVSRGDIILFDYGVNHRGVGTDITRPAVLGRASTRQREVAAAVKEIFECTLAAVRPGVTAGSVDRQAQRCFAQHGYADAYIHRTGHGLGTRPWEKPALSVVDKTVLRANMALAVEQGIYLQEEGIGIRLEDNLLVTATGYENMTTLSLDIVEL